ncbi:unnamed protein product [Closterium sp. Naga37s-1]|nr:unnamed protein product [Closterium sp. Naga37s-1]
MAVDSRLTQPRGSSSNPQAARNASSTAQNAAPNPTAAAELPPPSFHVDVAIAGGGLAGLALAAGLQSRGVEAAVFEAAPALRSNNSTVLVIWPNGAAALDGILPGLSAAMARHGTLRRGGGEGEADEVGGTGGAREAGGGGRAGGAGGVRGAGEPGEGSEAGEGSEVEAVDVICEVAGAASAASTTLKPACSLSSKPTSPTTRSGNEPSKKLPPRQRISSSNVASWIARRRLIPGATLYADAAHAMDPGPGQGALTGFEDAHQLSLCLGDSGDPDLFTKPAAVAAVREFEARRIRRCVKVHRHATGLIGYGEEGMEFKKRSVMDQMKATMEFTRWMYAYPDKIDGDPDSTFFQ